MGLSPEQGAHLVSIARRTVETVVEEGRAPRDRELPAWLVVGGDDFLRARRGAFVTLTSAGGALRGCIGLPYPVKPLAEAIVHAAVGAAAHDPRFPRVMKQELDSLMVEVSALTEPERIECEPRELPRHVSVGSDGLIVSGLGPSGLLLPQVGAEMGLAPDAFLSLTCRKAGLLPDAWLRADVQVQRFQAEVFTESAPRGAVGRGELRANP